MIKLESVEKVYRTEDIETVALHNLDLLIEEGDFVSIMGPSGCGKSTLLNILGLLDNPSGGSYCFLGEEVANYKEKQLAEIRKRNLGFIFQEFNLIDELSVFQNVELPLLYQGYSKAERKKKVEEILEEVEIAHRIGHFPGQLSGGQQQRVAIARALVARPKLILADEPTGNLDSALGEEVMNMLVSLNRKGTTLIMVTHSELHASYANQILSLLDGQLIQNQMTTKVRDEVGVASC